MTYCVASAAWQPSPGDGQQSNDSPSFCVTQNDRSRPSGSVGTKAVQPAAAANDVTSTAVASKRGRLKSARFRTSPTGG